MNYLCFKIKLLYQGKGLGLFCPEERVNRLERSLQRHTLGLESEYVESRIMEQVSWLCFVQALYKFVHETGRSRGRVE